MAPGWLRRAFAPLAPAPGRASDGAPEPDDVDALRRSLRETVALVNRSADRLPVGVVPRVRAVEDVLTELLDHAQATEGTSVSAQSRYALAATVHDYLPTSVRTFLALPPEFAATYRTPAGLSPGEELAEQLRLLEGAVRDLALAVYSGDAERLSTQGRFLATKFSRSDLDVP